MIGGAQLDRGMLGPPVAERTSMVVRDMMGCIGEPTLLSNAFPPPPARAEQPSRCTRRTCRAGARRAAPEPRWGDRVHRRHAEDLRHRRHVIAANAAFAITESISGAVVKWLARFAYDCPYGRALKRAGGCRMRGS